MNTRLLWTGLLVGVLAGMLVVAPTAGKPADTVGATAGDSVDMVDGLTDADGTQTVVVRLAESPDGAITTTNHDNPADAMQARADTASEPFERFAADTPHVAIDRHLWLANALLVTVDTDHVSLTRLGAIDNVERIHEDYAVSINTTTTTPPPINASRTGQTVGISSAGDTATTTTVDNTQFTSALETIDVPAAWQQFDTRGDGVRIAVIDTGVNPDHPDIDISRDHWTCLVNCSNTGDEPHDYDGHGTHVSATAIGGNNNDQQRQIGVAPNATLLHAKAIGKNGEGNFSTIIEGMQWAVKHDADILSASLAGTGNAEIGDELVEPVRNAQASGTIVVAAVGNSGSNTSTSPGNIYDVVGVGAVNVEPTFPNNFDYAIENDTVWEDSSGERLRKSEWSDPPADWPDEYTVPDLTAPGRVIWSADNELEQPAQCGGFNFSTDDLACLSGTSMATPHVAGVIALMEASHDGPLSPTEAETALETTAVDIGEAATRQGAGRIDADEAVAEVATSNSPVTITNVSITPNTVGDGEETTPTLRADVLNVSDDGQPDQFSVTMPQTISLLSVESITATDSDGSPITVIEKSSTERKITFAVAPNSEASLRDLNVTVVFRAQGK